MLGKLQCVEFLVSNVGNFMGTNLAEHLDRVCHHTITEFIQSEHLGVYLRLVNKDQDAILRPRRDAAQVARRVLLLDGV